MKILFLAPLIPAASGSGGKRAAFNHLQRLQEITTDIDMVLIDIENEQPSSLEYLAPADVHVFPRAIRSARGMVGAFLGLVQLVFDRTPRSVAVVASDSARTFIKKRLAERKFDLIVMEHLTAYGLIDGLELPCPVRYIAQNVETRVLQDRVAYAQESFLNKARNKWEIVKTERYEREILRAVDKVVAISSADALSPMFQEFGDKIFVWPELPAVKASSWSFPDTGTLLFVGSAAYFPNLDAIRWLVLELMPALRKIRTGVKLRIVGTSFDQVRELGQSSDVLFEGFVSDAKLEEFHLAADLFVSPVTLGSGIKIKVLEASSYGMPIAATSESLNGIDYLQGIALMIDRDAQASARKISEFLKDPVSMSDSGTAGVSSLLRALTNRPDILAGHGVETIRSKAL